MKTFSATLKWIIIAAIAGTSFWTQSFGLLDVMGQKA
jgi:hypothetical protein